MTPGEERALLAATAAGLDAELRDAQARLVQLIQSGMAPRDAVQAVMASFSGEMADTLAAAFSVMLGESIGAVAVMAMTVGAVPLSRHLYAQAASVSEEVAGLVDRHARGWFDARRLALELFEGYAFRDPAAEPLQFNRRNDVLPKYLREALIADGDMAKQIARAFAQLQVDGLSTQALRAAYQGVLDSLAGLEAGPGRDLLARRVEIAFYERMRYFSQRIALTELHRAYAQRQAAELMGDTDVDFVQWRMSPVHPVVDICDYFASVNRFGLGPGVYPKMLAPVAPAHPHCKCVLSPRLDLTGRQVIGIEGADTALFRSYDIGTAARIAGSQSKLQQVLAGADPWAVHNAGIDPAYRVRTVGQTVQGTLAGPTG